MLEFLKMLWEGFVLGGAYGKTPLEGNQRHRSLIVNISARGAYSRTEEGYVDYYLSAKNRLDGLNSKYSGGLYVRLFNDLLPHALRVGALIPKDGRGYASLLYDAAGKCLSGKTVTALPCLVGLRRADRRAIITSLAELNLALLYFLRELLTGDPLLFAELALSKGKRMFQGEALAAFDSEAARGADDYLKDVAAAVKGELADGYTALYRLARRKKENTDGITKMMELTVGRVEAKRARATSDRGSRRTKKAELPTRYSILAGILAAILLISVAAAVFAARINETKSLSDPETGISLNYHGNAFPLSSRLDLTLSISEVTEADTGDKLSTLSVSEAATALTAYGLSLHSGGREIQPEGTVEITLPVPDGYRTENTFVYRIDGDGAAEELTVTSRGESISALTDSISLFAVVERPFKVKFHGGEGVFHTSRAFCGENIQSVPEGQVREGYTFHRWETAQDGGARAELDPAAPILCDLDVYPLYTANEYTVSFTCGHDPIRVVFDGDYSLPISERVGYTVTGYTDGAGNAVSLMGAWKIAGDVTLSPIFENNLYSLSLCDDDGAELEKISVTYDMPFLLDGYSKAGASFVEWQTEDGKTFLEGVWTTPSDLTVYAKWDYYTYSLTLDYNDGVRESAVIEYTVKDLPSLGSPTHGKYPSYYIHGGWLTEDGSDFRNNLKTSPRSLTLTAVWDKVFADYAYISSAEELSSIGESGKYLLISDIDLGGKSWEAINVFEGELEGAGHCIYNFTMSKEGSGSGSMAFINSNSGTVRNLTVGKAGAALFDNRYSVKYTANRTESGSATSLYVAAIAAKNSGTIEDCKVVNTFVSAKLADNNNNENLALYVGGIAAQSSGRIISCSVTDCYVTAAATCASSDSGDDNYGYLGGIVAKNSGKIESATVSGTTLDLTVRGDGYIFNEAYPQAYIGGIVAYQTDGATLLSTVSENVISVYGSEGTWTHPTVHRGDICGKKAGGTVS